MPDVDARFARALALEDAGRAEDALACYRQLLADSPDHGDAWHNHGLLLARLGRLVEAEQSHRDYVRRCPSSTRAASDLADVLLALGRYDEVVGAVDHALRLNADEPDALLRRGIALSCLARFPEARESFSRARSSSPTVVEQFVRRVAPRADVDDVLSPENIYLVRTYPAQGECDWSRWSDYVAVMGRVASHEDIPVEPAVAYAAIVAPLSGAERHAIARRAAAGIERRISPMPKPQPRRRQRIRIGILSPDFRDHVVGYMLLPLFELAARSRFELFAYSLSADDGSGIRARLRAAADGFRDLERLSDAQAAAAIRTDDIDVLLDVCGYMSGQRFEIVAHQPARMHASYAGFSGSLGSRRVDFAIVDRIVAPDASEWTEELIHMPTFYLYDFRSPAGHVPLKRSDYGLPQDAFVFCAFHGAQKITPDTFDLWMAILREVPRSVLWFRALPNAAVRNLRLAAATRGIDHSRLVFAPFESSRVPRYLARQRLGDLLLDALHHNAITNACDALGVGLPVLTLRGTAMASRAGESLLCAAGMPELVATDPEAFVRLAVRIATQPGMAASIRARLLQSRASAPLFDTAARVRELQACIEHMVQVSDQRRSRL